MTGLLVKDIFLSKRFLIVEVIFFILLLPIDVILGVNFTGMVVIVITGVASMENFYEDESAEWNQFSLTMSITRKEIVLSKYVFVVIQMVGFVPAAIMVSFDTFFINITIMLLVFSILFPLVYKFGRVLGKIFWTAAMCIILMLFTIFRGVETKNATIDTNGIFSDIPIWAMLSIFFMSIIAYFFSFLCSYQIVKKKDFQ